jgi:hypothetical protein
MLNSTIPFIDPNPPPTIVIAAQCKGGQTE